MPRENVSQAKFPIFTIFLSRWVVSIFFSNLNQSYLVRYLKSCDEDLIYSALINDKITRNVIQRVRILRL